MRRSVLLCLAALAAANAYYLAIQEIVLGGDGLKDALNSCDDIQYLHVGDKSCTYDCFQVQTPDASPTFKLAYADVPYKTNAVSIPCSVELKDEGSKISFSLKPIMKTEEKLTANSTVEFTPISPDTTTTVATTVSSNGDVHMDPLSVQLLAKAPTLCQNSNMAGIAPCVAFCSDPKNANFGACTPRSLPVANTIKAIRKSAASRPVFATVPAELPAAVRLRGPGPALMPTRDSSSQDTVLSEEHEERRVKRDAAPVTVTVTYVLLDEPGNAAAVWAAVIEGIILLALVGACFWFFFWSPKSRAAQSAASQEAYKDTPNYSVSYANSSYNNQRIDAFQNNPAPAAPAAAPAAPAAPSRPANADYLNAWATDNIAAQQPAPAANPDPFQPRHQRVDSSGLVTVNLS